MVRTRAGRGRPLERLRLARHRGVKRARAKKPQLRDWTKRCNLKLTSAARLHTRSEMPRQANGRNAKFIGCGIAAFCGLGSAPSRERTGERNMRSTRTWRRGKRACAAIAGATAAVGAVALAVDTAAAAGCGDLAGKQYGDAAIMAATTVSPPSSLMGLDPPAPVAVNAPFCRVEGLIKTSESSQDQFEVWLPEKSAWNGKYQGVGNGGFAGSLILSPMTWALQAGYAVSATDTGHTGGTLYAAWALGHPRKIVDFGWRAIHGTAEASKAIIADYYGKPPAHAYFSGCSDGGREALMEAQRFPKDYEGIVAGAPANSWTKLLTTGVSVEQALDQPGAWLSPAKLVMISKAVFAQCPAESGYVEDPPNAASTRRASSAKRARRTVASLNPKRRR